MKNTIYEEKLDKLNYIKIKNSSIDSQENEKASYRVETDICIQLRKDMYL